jgi:biopolymer transport protein ExbB/TolQ
MTNPGFQAQQAAQQAQQAATQANLRFSADSSAQARRAAEMGRPRPQYYAYRRSGVRTGIGIVGRLIGLVVTLVGIAVALGIFALVLNQANPGALHHIVQWLGHIF